MDGIPVVLMEAMAMGRPVMVSSLSGIPELVDPASGWLLRPGDAGALERALREATDPRLRTARAENCRPKVASMHGIGASVESLFNMWSGILGGPRPDG